LLLLTDVPPQVLEKMSAAKHALDAQTRDSERLAREKIEGTKGLALHDKERRSQQLQDAQHKLSLAVSWR
jgi:hypothetical protein